MSELTGKRKREDEEDNKQEKKQKIQKLEIKDYLERFPSKKKKGHFYWCVVEDETLHEYINPDRNQLRKKYPLLGSKIILPEDKNSLKFSICLKTGVTLLFEATSSPSLTKWMKLFRDLELKIIDSKLDTNDNNNNNNNDNNHDDSHVNDKNNGDLPAEVNTNGNDENGTKKSETNGNSNNGSNNGAAHENDVQSDDLENVYKSNEVDRPKSIKSSSSS